MNTDTPLQNINKASTPELRIVEETSTYSRLSKKGKLLGLALPIAIIGVSIATITAFTPTQDVKINQDAVQAINQTKDTQAAHDPYNYYGYQDDYYGYYGYNGYNNNGYGSPDYRYISVQPTVAPVKENYNYTYTAPLPTVAPAPTNAPTKDVNGTTQQIIAVQQQINQRMVTCNDTARQQQAQIIALKQQQKQLYAQSDAIWNESYRLDNSTPAGEARRQQMAAQSYQLQAQGDAMTQTIYAAEGQFSTNKDTCWNNINALIQQREDLENKQWSQYDENMNLTLYLPY